MEDFLGLGGEDGLPLAPRRAFFDKLILGTGERSEKMLGRCGRELGSTHINLCSTNINLALDY